MDYLLTVDYFSGFFEIDKMTTNTASQVINKLKPHFARYGIPRQLVSDNGPQFSSREFEKCAHLWKFEHNTSSTMYLRSNGKAKVGVKLAKNTLRKTIGCGGDVQLALLELRNTPKQDAGASPAQILFGRQTQSLLPTDQLAESNEAIKAKKEKGRQSVKKHHDKTARRLDELKEGQPVYYKPFPEARWKHGVIGEKLEARWKHGVIGEKLEARWKHGVIGEKLEARWKHGVIGEKLDDRSYTVKDMVGHTYAKCTTPEAGSVSSADPSGVPESENDETCNNQPVARHDGDTPLEQELEEPLSVVTSPVGDARPSRT